MVASSGTKALQYVNFASIQDDQKANRQEKATAIDTQQKEIERTHDARIKSADAALSSAEKESNGTLLGTIFGGLLIGTLIGKAIGHATGSGDRDEDASMKKLAGESDIDRTKANDRFQDASDHVKDAEDRDQQLEKFSKELRSSDTKSNVV